MDLDIAELGEVWLWKDARRSQAMEWIRNGEGDLSLQSGLPSMGVKDAIQNRSNRQSHPTSWIPCPKRVWDSELTR
jgi:hypothetical protein